MISSKSIIFSSLLFASGIASAQETCKVTLAALNGTYEGECKKGKADGQGKAVGTDEYAGNFKDGLPNGKGIYYWKNGDVYDGQWVKGSMEGKGFKVFKRPGKPDSTVNGFWKKNQFVGRYEKPYVIHSQTSHFSRIEIRRASNNNTSTILFQISNTTGGVPLMGTTANGVKPTISDVSIMTGNYIRIVPLPDGPNGTNQKMTDVIFPFKARIKIGSQEMVIEILEDGDWLIDAVLNN